MVTRFRGEERTEGKQRNVRLRGRVGERECVASQSRRCKNYKMTLTCTLKTKL